MQRGFAQPEGCGGLVDDCPIGMGVVGTASGATTGSETGTDISNGATQPQTSVEAPGARLERVRERQVEIWRQVQHLLQAQESHLTFARWRITSGDWLSRVTGPGSLQTPVSTGIEPGLRLTERRAGLLARRFRDADETVAERGVVVGLRHLEEQLPREVVTQRLAASRPAFATEAWAPRRPPVEVCESVSEIRQLLERPTADPPNLSSVPRHSRYQKCLRNSDARARS